MSKDMPDNPRTLGETVTAEIRRKLVDGELVPGQRLSEAALSEETWIFLAIPCAKLSVC